MASPLSPRINASLIPSHAGRSVTLVGRVVQASSPSSCELLCADRGVVLVHTLAGGQGLTLNQVYELTCKVDDKGQVFELGRLAFNTDFDLDSYNDFVKLAHNPQVRLSLVSELFFSIPLYCFSMVPNVV